MMTFLLCGLLGGIPFDAPEWSFEAQEVVRDTWLGRPALKLAGGIAYLENVDFENGVIEFDLALLGGRGFMGAIWRMQPERHYEEFYIRPHQAGNPDANQYTPVYHGQPGWQLYHGPQYAAPVTYPVGEWFPVKIVVAGKQADIYIGTTDTPTLSVSLKGVAKPGKVGLSAGRFAPAWFSNFRVTPIDRPELLGKPVPAPPPPAGSLGDWQLSEAFAFSALEIQSVLPESPHSWQSVSAEPHGLLNIARFRAHDKAHDTVLARITLVADEAGNVPLQLGYSDEVLVYLDGRAIYAGHNKYRSRDYRYLGTIGLFDTVFLDLTPGKHQLSIAVHEEGGGWGLMAALAPVKGVTVMTSKVLEE